MTLNQSEITEVLISFFSGAAIFNIYDHLSDECVQLISLLFQKTCSHMSRKEDQCSIFKAKYEAYL